jgi:hypothetical protein
MCVVIGFDERSAGTGALGHSFRRIIKETEPYLLPSGSGATLSSNPSLGSENSLELRPLLLPLAFQNTQANHVVRSIASHDAAPEARFLHETKRFVQPQNAPIEIKGLATQLVELQLPKDILQGEVFREHAHILPPHVGPDYVKSPVALSIASIDVIEIEQPYVFLLATDDPVPILGITEHAVEPGCVLFRTYHMIREHVAPDVRQVAPQADRFFVRTLKRAE